MNRDRKLSTALGDPRQIAKEKGNEKETFPPTTPYRVKAKGKESKPGVLKNPFKSARARTCAKSRYHEADLCAQELMDVLGSTSRADHRLWAFYCYHHDHDIILDMAYAYASMQRQGEIRNAVSAFQAWLTKSFAEGGVA